jgi:hypothetical protein
VSTLSPDGMGTPNEMAGSEDRGERDAPDRRAAATNDRRSGDRRVSMDRRSGLDRRRGPGRRRGEIRRAAEEGELSGDLLDFVMAVDEYKRVNDRPYPTISEIFEIVQFLGYRKVDDRADHINIREDDVS